MSDLALNFRWPFDATLMNAFEQLSGQAKAATASTEESTASTALLRPVGTRCPKGLRRLWSRGAKAEHARMSSSVKYGYFSRTWAGERPAPRASNTSDTVIRIPRMQGFPLRTPQSTVMIERLSTTIAYASYRRHVRRTQILSLRDSAGLVRLVLAGAFVTIPW